MFLPHSSDGCKQPWHDHTPYNGPYNVWQLLGNGCDSMRVEGLLMLLSTEDTAALIESLRTPYASAADQAQALIYYTPRYWQPVVAAIVAAHVDPHNTGHRALSYDDLYCHSCDRYVSKVLDREHWDTICNVCQHHGDECECCQTCHYSPCECCPICHEGPTWECDCCEYCDSIAIYCSCRLCEGCGYKTPDCSCSSGSSYSFGSTKVAPWLSREDAPLDVTLPKMADCQHDSIDPVQAAADFYLLDAIKNLVRTGDLKGNEDTLTPFLMNRRSVIENDSMLSALVTSAERSHRALVDYLAPNFLAYALPAVGGELRYHRSANKAKLGHSRDTAWDTFVDIVQAKGAETLFEADTLFREFNNGAYGGEKWGAAAKIVGQYLRGDMPAWLFVDRVFTLQHNGGCFLNKVNWARRNGLKWGLSKMLNLLNAHAGTDVDGTDWATLIAAASPAVRDMFLMSERHIARIGRRYGATLAPFTRRSHASIRSNRYAYSDPDWS